MQRINVAIDGPSAAGKSTISDLLAKKLGYVHLDTGAMYRCVALKALQNGIALDDESALTAMLEQTDIRLTPDGKVYLDGTDVSEAIRKDNVSMAASDVSKLKQVRIDLVRRQQQMATAKGFIMDGRDIGTVVLKDAEVKIFMTATAHARALRRFAQNQEKGICTSDLETIEQEIQKRDDQDTHRANSPLRKADDAVEIDTSDMTIDQVVDTLYRTVLQKTEQEVS
ncbi:MAG: (d)CMP kinase [Solobacterium sp.]|jgi:cytidylate kinase|nr:(d)CMP kinase [Solobacterium sp.]MCH4222210.1 (d)CMP kinase [Solobacterium sp.]MCH4266201.1 (d)CMP kinase [Solobacterium sp.]